MSESMKLSFWIILTSKFVPLMVKDSLQCFFIKSFTDVASFVVFSSKLFKRSSTPFNTVSSTSALLKDCFKCYTTAQYICIKTAVVVIEPEGALLVLVECDDTNVPGNELDVKVPPPLQLKPLVNLDPLALLIFTPKLKVGGAHACCSSYAHFIVIFYMNFELQIAAKI